MLSFSKKSRVATLAFAAFTLAACSQEQKAAETPATAQSAVAGYATLPFGAASITDNAGTITATRNGEGTQGVSIVQAPILVSFTASGAGVRVRVRQDGDWIVLPRAESYSVAVGAGFASSIRVSSLNASAVNVRVTSVTPCADLQEGACTAATGTAEAD